MCYLLNHRCTASPVHLNQDGSSFRAFAEDPARATSFQIVCSDGHQAFGKLISFAEYHPRKSQSGEARYVFENDPSNLW